ncbi:hypothetical protein E2C01_034579 [Portunus trituberculatus]|uniref:Uncharacterized protein n=1 Tax=Portunus trituberculatus TaxID=210409 RepID=A0A5B7F701_PORTR|nr:hypothetical protein [Portunus trituberculatus]
MHEGVHPHGACPLIPQEGLTQELSGGKCLEEAQPTLGPWTGFEPVRLETPRTPKHAWFHCRVSWGEIVHEDVTYKRSRELIYENSEVSD